MPEHVGNMWEPRQDLRGSPGTPPGSLLLAQASGRTVRRAPSSPPSLHPSPRTRAQPGPAACSLPGACHPSAAGLEREPWPAHRQPAPRGTVRSLRGACAEVPRQAPRSEALLPHCAPGRLPPGSEPWFRGPLVRPHPWASSAPPPSVQGARHLCGGVWFLLVSCAIWESGLPARSAGSCAPVASYTVPRARATISITAVSLLLLTNAGVCSGVMPEPQAGVGAPTRRPGSLGHLGRVI